MTGLGHMCHVKAKLNNSKQRNTMSEQTFLVLCYRLPRQLHNHNAWNKTEASQVDILGLEPSCTS